MSMAQTRIQHPIRFRKARADAKIESIQGGNRAEIRPPLGLHKDCHAERPETASQHNGRSPEKELGVTLSRSRPLQGLLLTSRQSWRQVISH
jgi:hypothetical protein